MNNLLFLLLLMPTASAVAAEQSPYLKEILEGRCYYAPPTREASAPELCPLVVGSFMNLLESHLDADISVPDFDPYLEKADFSSPQDKALLYLHFFGDSSSPFVTPPGFVSPEDTPGGALLRNLVFCGVDQRGNCSVEKSKAYWTFWEAAYARFARKVQGHLQIVVEPNADVQFLHRSAISNLQVDMISSATVYGRKKETDILAGYLRAAGIENIVYKEEITEFYLDSLNVTPGKDESGDPKDNNSNRNGTYGLILVVFLVTIIGLRYFASDHNDKTPFTSTVYCRRQLEAFQEHWRRMYATFRETFQPWRRNHDIETNSEDTSLLNNNAENNFLVDEFGCRIPTHRAVAQ